MPQTSCAAAFFFVDGGSDAYFRADDWPGSLPVRRLAPYLWKFKRFKRFTQ